jgi:hypothetical protein
VSRYEPVLIEEPYQSNPWAGMEEDRDGEYVKYKEYQLLEKEIAELEKALLWSRDSNTGFEPSVSVMHRYYDELLPKGGVADD